MSKSLLPHASSRRLLFELGRGGMGTVYLAVAEGVGGFEKLKVLKQLRHELAREPDALAMFLEEARLAARLHHPNVVQTNEVGVDGSTYSIEMEYLEGQTLDALDRELATKGGVPIALLVWTLAQALAGLDYAHKLTDRRGNPLHIVHRDVSPHNLFLTYHGEVKVLDFGIAKAADSSTKTESGVFKGKLHYMAPEQAIKGLYPLDHRADVFCVGILLWQALAGRRFWQGSEDFDIFNKLSKGTFESPKAFRPEADDRLCAICMRSLAAAPSDRYASAADFGRALEGWLDSGGARVGPAAIKALLSGLFEKQRAESDRLIEDRIRTAPPSDARGADDANVPLLSVSGPPTASEPADGRAPMDRGVTARGFTVTRTAAKLPLPRDPSLPPAPAPRRRPTLALAVIAALLVGFGGYAVRENLRGRASAAASSLAAARTPTACYADADCAGTGTDWLCGGRGICVAKKGCASNAECTRTHEGRPHVCRKDDGACVAVESEGCRLLAEPGDIENDHVVLVGVMFPHTGENVDFGAAQERSIDLARRDVAHVAHGLPAPGAAPPRPLALVSCDDVKDGKAVAHHLVEDLHVPAIVGFGSGALLLELAPSLYVPNRVMVLAAVNRADMITRVAQPAGEPRLVYRTTTSSGQAAIPMSRVVDQLLEPPLRKSLGAEEVRVAFVRPSAANGIAFADALFRELKFNGKSALENKASFKELVYGDPTGEQAPLYEAALAELLVFRPHIVLYLGEDALVRNVFEPLEKKWPKAVPRPHYVSDRSPTGPELYRFFAGDPERRARVLGLNLPGTTVPNARFTLHYNETYADKKTSTNESPTASYDALYAIAYATAALGAEPISGPSLSRAIARLVPPGLPVDVGPAKLLEGFAALRSGKTIDLGGAETNLDLDPATGEPSVDFVVLCGRLNDAKRLVESAESGVYYRGRTRELEGSLKCP